SFTGVSLEQVGERRVRVGGARHAGRPSRLKVSGFVARPGAIADVEIAYAGAGALERGRRAADVLRLRLAKLGVEEFRVDLVGVDALLGAASVPLDGDPPEVRAHVSAACDGADLARAVEDEVYALTLAGPAGGAGIRSEVRPRVDVVDGLLGRAAVTTAIAWETAG
ncbi:MAG: acyclic terpene utilization AtuA family protein, partial [Solirubrobacteraceae bacterium]